MFLQMDGIDDRITLPSMTLTEIVIDFRVDRRRANDRYWTLPLGAEGFFVAAGTGAVDQWTAGVTLYLNGVLQTNNTQVINVGERVIVRSVFPVKTNVIYIFSNNTSTINKGAIWDIKVYNGATLQAHYDMTLGNVLDQSGNGRDATLVGGTWIDDGPVGTDVSYSYATKQVVYADRETAAATKQLSYANHAYTAATEQRVYADTAVAAPTKQRVYAERSYPYATLQVIADGGVSVSYAFATKQVVYASRETANATMQLLTADRVEQAATRQQVTAARQYAAPTEQVIYANRSTAYKTAQRLYTDRVYAYSVLIKSIDPDAPTYVQNVYYTIKITRRMRFETAIARVKKFNFRL